MNTDKQICPHCRYSMAYDCLTGLYDKCMNAVCPSHQPLYKDTTGQNPNGYNTCLSCNQQMWSDHLGNYKCHNAACPAPILWKVAEAAPMTTYTITGKPPVPHYILYLNVGDLERERAEEYADESREQIENWLKVEFPNVSLFVMPIQIGVTRLEKLPT